MAEPSPRRVEELFDRAIDLDPARRAAFLDEQCGADADLRDLQEIRSTGAGVKETSYYPPLAKA